MAEPYTVVVLSPLRKAIAARMTEAKRNIPHCRPVSNILMDELFALRERQNVLRPNEKASVNDCLVKACAGALMEHPEINVQLVDNVLHRYQQADISVVIAVEGGLATPVVRGANAKSVWNIATEIKDLTARAGAKQLRWKRFLGGSVSVSNLGGYGVDQFDAIINPPEGAILAVGRAQPQVVVSENGETRVARSLTASLSVYHRAIDGVTAARFMATLRRIVEQPQGLYA